MDYQREYKDGIKCLDNRNNKVGVKLLQRCIRHLTMGAAWYGTCVVPTTRKTSIKIGGRGGDPNLYIGCTLPVHRLPRVPISLHTASKTSKESRHRLAMNLCRGLLKKHQECMTSSLTWSFEAPSYHSE